MAQRISDQCLSSALAARSHLSVTIVLLMGIIGGNSGCRDISVLTTESSVQASVLVDGSSAAPASDVELDSGTVANLASLSGDRTTQFSAWLGAQDPTTLDSESLWALAACNGCAPRATAAWTARAVSRPGALPELLMPDVRLQVRDNSTIKSLISQPDSLIGFGIKAFLNSGNSLQQQIHPQIWAMVVSGLSLPSAVAAPNFVFDGFQSTTGDGQFSLAAQSVFWEMAVASPELWKYSGTVTPVYAHEQALNVMRTFDEWKYLFGIKDNTTDPTYGGLAFTIDGSGELEPFDPRNSNVADHIVAGSYKVTYPITDTLDLALETHETWKHTIGPVTLKEQAEMWLTAAQGLKMTRPKNRAPGSKLYATTGILPSDAYLLPLTFVLGLKDLLGGPILDKANLKIFGQANIPLSPVANQSDADFISTVRLGEALLEWQQQLSSLDDLELSDAIKAEATGSQDSLLDGLRLAVTSTIKYPGLTDPSAAAVSVGDVAEGLAYMLASERLVLNSPVLHAALITATAKFFSARVSPALNGKLASLQARDILSLQRLATELAVDSNIPTSLADAAAWTLTSCNRSLSQWGAQH